MNNLEDIKAGDEVILRPAFSRVRCIAVVERTTLTRIFVGGRAYVRRTGRKVGSSEYSSERVEGATPKNRERLAAELANAAMNERKRAARLKLERVVVTDENIDAVEAFLSTQVAP